ncbi:MAG: hypothetical protein GF320_11120 [Armatimonadia bacterium]|nr:hypothetical protein [Armatimonadia bacterium]
MSEHLLDTGELDQLAQLDAPYCVSIYMPTHPKWPESEQDPVRFGNLVSEAEERLLAGGLDKREVQQLLAPTEALREDQSFWRHGTQGLAYYLHDGGDAAFRLLDAPGRLVTVSESFHLKPAIPTAQKNRTYYVLALSQGAARLVECTPTSASKMDVPDMPDSLDHAIGYEGRESRIQFHTGTAGNGGDRRAMYHGHGKGADQKLEHLRKYLNQVQKSITRKLAGEGAPLILAGVDYVRSQYSELNDYAHMLSDGLSGNPEEMSEKDLQEAGWELVEPRFRVQEQEDLEAYARSAGTGRASSELVECLTGAHRGRVRALFVDRDAHRWGNYRLSTGDVEMHDSRQPGDRDLLNLAALLTLRMGGRVHAMESERLPAQTPIAALFRFE